MKRQLTYLALAAFGLGLACSDDTVAVPKKDTGRKDRSVRDLGQPVDQGEIPDAPSTPDQAKPDQFTFFTDSSTKDLPKTADKGKTDKPATGKEAGGPAPANDACTSAETLTWNGTTITRTVDTTNAKDDIDLDSSDCTGDYTSGHDVFYKITLPAGKYDLKLTGANDGALYVLSSCSVTACVQGSDNIGSGVEEKVTLTVSSSTTYIIGVDAYDPVEAGSYTLTIASAGSAPDGGPKPDVSKVDAGPKPDGPAGSATIVITEIMANPDKVGDDKGEWFEVYNAGTATVNLKGWKIVESPSATDGHVITTDVLVQAGKYIVLGNNASSTTNGGVTVAYAYPAAASGSLNFSNSPSTSDAIYLYNAGGTLVDNVSWTSTTVGASRSLKSPSLDNSVAANWCTETAAWGASTDKGTPGAAAGCP